MRDRIHWADSDPMGIVFYGAYVRLIGVAESEMFRACGLPVNVMRCAVRALRRSCLLSDRLTSC